MALPEGFEEDIPHWVRTFGVDCDDVNHLCSGAELTAVMRLIAPAYFEYTLVTGDSWAAYKSNMSSLLAGIDQFYETSLGGQSPFRGENFVDLDVLCRDKDLHELAKVVQGVVGAAVSCDAKDQYINMIMEMSEEAQQTLFHFAQAAMQGPEEVDEEAINPESAVNARGQPDADKHEALPAEVTALTEENASLQAQVAKLTADLDEQKSKFEAEMTELHARHERDLDEMKATLMGQNQDLQVRLEKALDRIKSTESRLRDEAEDKLRKDRVQWENEMQRLRDEKEVLTGKMADYNQLKAREEKLRARLEDTTSSSKLLRERLDEAEGQITKHLDRILHLESVEKEVEFNKKRTEDYQDKAQDLEKRCVELESRLKVMDGDLVTAREELRDATEKAQYFEDEAEEARHALEGKGDDSTLGATSVGVLDDHVPFKAREQITRLEAENAKLRQEAAGLGQATPRSDAAPSSEQLEYLEAQIQDRTQRTLQLETENATMRSDVERLEHELKESRSKGSSHQAMLLTVKKQSEELKRKESEINSLASDKERLEAYTKKALHNVQDKYLLAIKTCKDQIRDKDEKIQKLSEQYKQLKHQSGHESQLLSSAIYELGMSITEQRLSRTLDSKASSRGNAGDSTWLQNQRGKVSRGSLQGGSY